MRQSKALEIWVGIFVAFGIVALFYLAMRVSNLSDIQTSEGYLVTARFQNIGGLRVRAPVSIGGVTIGRVVGIRYDETHYQAVVEMRIDSRYDKIPDDTSASIYTKGLLGEQYVGLEPGGSLEYLGAGDEIELTQSAVVLEQLIGRFLFSQAEEGGKK